VTQIWDYAFYGAGLTELTIPEGVTFIGNCFIDRTSLKSITLPASLTEWESGWYYPIDGLTDVTILCEATLDNVGAPVDDFLYKPVTIHVPAGSVVEGYINRQIQTNKDIKCTVAPIK